MKINLSNYTWEEAKDLADLDQGVKMVRQRDAL